MKYWPYINFVGHMDSVADYAERLLRHVGGEDCWQKFGATGWGSVDTTTDPGHYRDRAIFQRDDSKDDIIGNDNGSSINGSSTAIKVAALGSNHATDARERLKAYYTPELEQKVDEYCYGDYHIPALNLTRNILFPTSSN